MEPDVQQRIRERAYAIWLDEGCPQGRDAEHWLRAEQDILLAYHAAAPVALNSGAEPGAGAEGALPPAAGKNRTRTAPPRKAKGKPTAEALPEKPAAKKPGNRRKAPATSA